MAKQAEELEAILEDLNESASETDALFAVQITKHEIKVHTLGTSQEACVAAQVLQSLCHNLLSSGSPNISKAMHN